MFLSSIFMGLFFYIEILIPSGICFNVRSEDKIQLHFFPDGKLVVSTPFVEESFWPDLKYHIHHV